jgi:hypothetical protein
MAHGAHDDQAAFNVKQYAPIADPKPVTDGIAYQPFHVATKVIS